jgi:hypothetical protein
VVVRIPKNIADNGVGPPFEYPVSGDATFTVKVKSVEPIFARFDPNASTVDGIVIVNVVPPPPLNVRVFEVTINEFPVIAKTTFPPDTGTVIMVIGFKQSIGPHVTPALVKFNVK